jgi:hypothetical protein
MKRVAVEFLAGSAGCLVAGLGGLLAGASFGGTYLGPFQFGGLRGYQLGAVLGAVIGGVPGAALGSYRGRRRFNHGGNFLWGACGAVVGAVTVMCILFLLPAAWLIALMTLVPGGAVVGLEMPESIRSQRGNRQAGDQQ